MRISYRDLSQVERLELFTQHTLIAMLWLMVASFGLAPASRSAEPSWLIGLGILLVLANWVVLRFCRTWAQPGALDVVLLGAAGLISAVLLREAQLGSDSDIRSLAIAMVWCVAWPLGAARGAFAVGRMVLLATVVGGVATSAQSPAPAWVDASAGASLGLLFAVISLLTVRLSVWMLEVVRRLEEARDAEAALAVAEERLRFSRDVHDVLGRHLSTIAVTSELAASLARRGDPTAAQRMLEVREHAHEALREARELAQGYRAPDLAQEVAGARALLTAAGIEADLALEEVPEQWQEAVALTLREAVTNVLRHSRATRVLARWDGRSLVVDNDGAPDTTPGRGQGLVGLAERVEPRGGRIDTTRQADRFRLMLTTTEGDR